MEYRVIVRRRNGRYLKEVPARSRYRAKKIKEELEARYDNGFYVEVKAAFDSPTLASYTAQDGVN